MKSTWHLQQQQKSDKDSSMETDLQIQEGASDGGKKWVIQAGYNEQKSNKGHQDNERGDKMVANWSMQRVFWYYTNLIHHKATTATNDVAG